MTHDNRMTLPPAPAKRKRLAPVISKAEAGRIIGIARQNVDGAIARGELRVVPLPDGRLGVTRASALRAKRTREKRAALKAA